jgi:hypothetical protein
MNDELRWRGLSAGAGLQPVPTGILQNGTVINTMSVVIA